MLSHLVYGHADDDPVNPRHVDGWIVWIYYPHNYVKDDNNDGVEDNPRGLGMDPVHPQTGPASVDDPITEERDDYGFTFSVTGGTVKEFAQASGPCTDERIGPFVLDSEDNRAAGKDNRDDYYDVPCGADESNYCVQIFVKSSASKITLSIRWTHGMYAPQTQSFNIMKEVSMREYDATPPPDPGHTNQHRWD